MCCKESKSKQKRPPVPVLKVASKRQYALNTYHLGPPKLYFPPFVFRDCIYQIPNGNIFNNGIIVTTYNTRSLECIVCFFSPPLLTYKGGSFEPLEPPLLRAWLATELFGKERGWSKPNPVTTLVTTLVPSKSEVWERNWPWELWKMADRYSICCTQRIVLYETKAVSINLKEREAHVIKELSIQWSWFRCAFEHPLTIFCVCVRRGFSSSAQIMKKLDFVCSR